MRVINPDRAGGESDIGGILRREIALFHAGLCPEGGGIRRGAGAGWVLTPGYKRVCAPGVG